MGRFDVRTSCGWAALAAGAVIVLSGCSGSGSGAAEVQPKTSFVSAAPGQAPVDWLEGDARTAPVKVFFAYDPNVDQRRPPFTRPVIREVRADDAGMTALQQLFEGPRPDEAKRGLRFESSGATGIRDVRVGNGIARVYLTGGCNAQGSVVTVADQITAILEQFPIVEHVKVYGPDGTTTDPDGATDSIPTCLATTMSPTALPQR